MNVEAGILIAAILCAILIVGVIVCGIIRETDRREQQRQAALRRCYEHAYQKRIDYARRIAMADTIWRHTDVKHTPPAPEGHGDAK